MLSALHSYCDGQTTLRVASIPQVAQQQTVEAWEPILDCRHNVEFVFLSFYSVETHPSKVYSLCRKIIWRAYSVPYIYCKKHFSPEVVMAFLINYVFLFLPDNMPSDSDRDGCRSSVTSKAAGSRRIRVRAAGTAARRTGTKYD